MEVHEVPGTHLDMIKEPHVEELAKKVDECLRKAQTGHCRITLPEIAEDCRIRAA